MTILLYQLKSTTMTTSEMIVVQLVANISAKPHQQTTMSRLLCHITIIEQPHKMLLQPQLASQCKKLKLLTSIVTRVLLMPILPVVMKVQ